MSYTNAGEMISAKLGQHDNSAGDALGAVNPIFGITHCGAASSSDLSSEEGHESLASDTGPCTPEDRLISGTGGRYEDWPYHPSRLLPVKLANLPKAPQQYRAKREDW